MTMLSKGHTCSTPTVGRFSDLGDDALWECDECGAPWKLTFVGSTRYRWDKLSRRQARRARRKLERQENPMASDQTFEIELPVSARLTVAELWPDGDAPENPTVEDVHDLLESRGDPLRLAAEWNLDVGGWYVR